MESWAGLDGYRNSCPHLDSVPGLSSPYRATIPTELSRPWNSTHNEEFIQFFFKKFVERSNPSCRLVQDAEYAASCTIFYLVQSVA